MKKYWKPKQCQIGPLVFEVSYVIPGKGKILKKGDVGAVDQSLCLIEIDKRLTHQMFLLVFIHEVCHAIGDCMQPNNNPFSDETTTCITSSLLLQALKSSKLLNA